MSIASKTAAEIDTAVRSLITESFDRATEILTRNRSTLDETAAKLLDQETLSDDEMPTIAWEGQETTENVAMLQQHPGH